MMSIIFDNTVRADTVEFMLAKYFQEFGFNEKEEKVYLSLAELGKATAGVLSKKTNIPRATVYSVLESLSTKGVISQEQTRGTTLYVAGGPSVFLRLIETEREKLQEREKMAQELAEFLEPYFKGTQYSIPKLQFFEGRQNIENMLYDYLPIWRESYTKMKDFTLWGYQDHTFVEQYRKWHEFLWRTKNEKEKICLFSNPSDIEKELDHKIPNREVRPLPQGVQFSSSIWIYGEYIVMAITRQKPHYAFQLKDTVFASNLRTIFQLLWKAKF